MPTLGIARTLVERGHDVRLLGRDTIADLCSSVGARFVALTQGPGWDSMEDPDDFEAEVELLIEELCFSTTISRDLARELDREPADAVLVDCMLFTAIDVALASGTPTAALFHTPYTIFRGGPLVEMFAPGLAIANAHRAALGLPAIETLGDIHDACDYAIVAAPKEFEPDVLDAANVLRIGPVLDAPPLSRELDKVNLRDGMTPVVLISLSTSEQGQAALLQRCVDAVAQLPVRAIVTTGASIDPASVNAGDNTHVARYIPHADILASAEAALGLRDPHPFTGAEPDESDSNSATIASTLNSNRPTASVGSYTDTPMLKLTCRTVPQARTRPGWRSPLVRAIRKFRGETAAPVNFPRQRGIIDPHDLGDHLLAWMVVARDATTDWFCVINRLSRADRHVRAHTDAFGVGRVIQADSGRAHCEHRANRGGVVGERPATDATQEDVLQRPGLLGRGLLVDVENNGPRRPRLVVVVRPGKDDGAAGQIRAVGVAPLDAPRQYEVTLSVRRTASAPVTLPATRAHRVAVARLEVTPGDLPLWRHCDPFSATSSTDHRATRPRPGAPPAPASREPG